MKQIKVNGYVFYAMWVLIFAVIAISYLGINDANSCLSNPLVYGANKATSDETGELQCSCTFSNPSYVPLYFNHEKMSTKSYEIFTGDAYESVGAFVDEE